MKHVLTQIFVSLGVIFFILILIGVYFFVTDPLNIKPLLFGVGSSSTQQREISDTGGTDTSNAAVNTQQVQAEGGFQLSDGQKQALVSFGIDPTTVPSSISAEQETCFVSVLGEARVAEIKAGAVPSALEFFRAKSCI